MVEERQSRDRRKNVRKPIDVGRNQTGIISDITGNHSYGWVQITWKTDAEDGSATNLLQSRIRKKRLNEKMIIKLLVG